MSTLDAKLSALAAQALAAHGLVLVQARLTGGTNNRGKLTLSVLAERPDGSSPNVDDCTAASRTLSAQLDVADILTTAYTLEVGSPGLERPLTTMADYVRFEGKQAKVTFTRTKTFTTAEGKAVGVGSVVGIILPSADTTVNLQPNDFAAPVAVEMDDIRYAHLSPSADELKAMMKAANTRPVADETETLN